MSYDTDFVLDTETDEVADDETAELDIDIVEKVTSKKQRVATRRRIEDILAEKTYKGLYGDIYDEDE
jgi:hypothetical protein